MRGLINAARFLTRLPLPAAGDWRADDLARAAPWFPVAGLMVGGAVALACWLGARTDPWLGALLGLAAWVGVTGALHLDGLADLADALGAAHRLTEPAARRERLLAVLADPHLGAFGAVALVLQLMAKLVLLMLAARAGAFWALALIPAWARWGTLVWSRLESLKPGLGRHLALRAGPLALWGWPALLLAGGFIHPALLAAPIMVLAWHAYLHARLGGMTGDALGAGVEVVECGVLLAVVAG